MDRSARVAILFGTLAAGVVLAQPVTLKVGRTRVDAIRGLTSGFPGLEPAERAGRAHPLSAVPPGGPAQPAVRSFPDVTASRAGRAGGDAGVGPTAALDLALDAAPPPTADFRARMSSIYATTQEDLVLAVWTRYLDQFAPADRAQATGPLDNARVGNAIVKTVLARDEDLGGARRAGLNPAASEAQVRAGLGVSVRSRPWGPIAGETIPSGTVLRLDPPADGVWYRLQAGGWVCGLWLDFR
jgi:hypothetical protein